MNLKVFDNFTASGGSRKGLNHRKNDDRFLIKPLDAENLLLAVSDGMGGHPAGDVAAEDIIKCLGSIDSDTTDKAALLTTAIHRADGVIRNRVSKVPLFEGMGATVTTAIIGNGQVWWGHIGDSRMYLLRGEVMRQMTRDHSFLQDLIDSGDVTEEEAANHPMSDVLDQCVGCIDAGTDSGMFAVIPGDIILLCTDGLYRTVPDAEIATILSSSASIAARAERLLESSWKSGSIDDTTVVVATLSD